MEERTISYSVDVDGERIGGTFRASNTQWSDRIARRYAAAHLMHERGRAPESFDISKIEIKNCSPVRSERADFGGGESTGVQEL